LKYLTKPTKTSALEFHILISLVYLLWGFDSGSMSARFISSECLVSSLIIDRPIFVDGEEEVMRVGTGFTPPHYFRKSRCTYWFRGRWVIPWDTNVSYCSVEAPSYS